MPVRPTSLVALHHDVDLVMATLQEVAEEHPLVLKEPPPQVFFLRFGDDYTLMGASPEMMVRLEDGVMCSVVRGRGPGRQPLGGEGRAAGG